MSQIYRIAIVGCGGISHAHGNACLESEQLDLVAACDINPQALKRFSDQFNVEHTYADLHQMLEKQTPDVLVIATWPAIHLNNILEAVRGNAKAILCEKPIALNANQVEQMIQIATNHNILLMEGFMYRHHPLTLTVKQKIESGEIGEIRYIRSTFTTGLTDYTNWRLRGDLGGGAMMDLGCYCINAIRYFVGSEPKRIWTSGKYVFATNVWETVCGTFDFGNGVYGQFDSGFGTLWRESYEIVGTAGSILAPIAWGNNKGNTSFILNGETIEVNGVNPFEAELSNLCQATSTNETLLVSLEDSLNNARVIDATHESAKSGRCVTVEK